MENNKKEMGFNDYQKGAMRTRNPKNNTVKKQLIQAALGLAEAGEFTNIVKKIYFQGHELNEDSIDDMLAELGDVMWYIACACEALETRMEVVATKNIRKLRHRYPNKFDEELSKNRGET